VGSQKTLNRNNCGANGCIRVPTDAFIRIPALRGGLTNRFAADKVLVGGANMTPFGEPVVVKPSVETSFEESTFKNPTGPRCTEAVMKSLTRLFVLACVLVPGLCAINVKVTEINAKKGEVKLLLPMHSTYIEAKIIPEGGRVRLQRDQFYEGKMILGPVEGPGHNLIRVKIPHQKPARFLIKKISFIVR